MITLKVEIIIDDETIQDLKNRCKDCYGVILNDKQIGDTLCEDYSLAKSIEEWGGSDTDNADRFINAFIWKYLKVMGWKWPIGGDPLHYKQRFYPAFYKACQNKEVQLNWTLDDFIFETGKIK